jgi:hypothetical protein
MTTMGRAIVTFFLVLIAVGVVVGIGSEVYNTGFAQGVLQAEHVPAGQPVPVPGYGYGYGYGYHGFNFLGLLFPLFFLFIIFGLIRAAFGRGRGWGPGYGRGHGWGPGWGAGWDKSEGLAGPTAWREERDRRMAELHRRLHEEEPSGKPPTTDTGASSGSVSS